MIKVFTTNKNGKIELTAKELKEILDEAYWEGYRANSLLYTYTTPNWTPYVFTANNASTTFRLNTKAVDASEIKSGVISATECNIKNVVDNPDYEG